MARKWRVVQVEDEWSTDISTLFTRILDRVYDPLEPFRPLETDRDAPIRAKIGSSQNSTDFQDIPVIVCIVDAVSLVSTSSSISCTKTKRQRVHTLYSGEGMLLKFVSVWLVLLL